MCSGIWSWNIGILPSSGPTGVRCWCERGIQQEKPQESPGDALPCPALIPHTATCMLHQVLLKTEQILPVRVSPDALTFSRAAQGQSSSGLAQLLPGHPLSPRALVLAPAISDPWNSFTSCCRERGQKPTFASSARWSWGSKRTIPSRVRCVLTCASPEGTEAGIAALRELLSPFLQPAHTHPLQGQVQPIPSIPWGHRHLSMLPSRPAEPGAPAPAGRGKTSRASPEENTATSG